MSLVVFGTVFLAGCGQWQTSQTQLTTPAPVAQQSPMDSSVPTQPTLQKQEVQDKTVPVPSNWTTYTDSRYGFELRLPGELIEQIFFEGSVTVSGKTYKTIQLTNVGANGESVRIIKGWSNPAIDPYGNKQYSNEPQIALSGITWNVFYNPEQDLAGCEMATFQTLMPNGNDTIVVYKHDPTECPGNSEKSPSIAFLKQALSTFKFTK
ncbi:MAG: hypothetical protein HYV45_00890 [Candidatus Moranbacteria bacterium]|nr:hypothetical protein [Candidatus Moranbacteria bacterium]